MMAAITFPTILGLCLLVYALIMVTNNIAKKNRFLMRRYRRVKRIMFAARYYKYQMQEYRRQVEEIADCCDKMQVDYANRCIELDKKQIELVLLETAMKAREK